MQLDYTYLCFFHFIIDFSCFVFYIIDTRSKEKEKKFKTGSRCQNFSPTSNACAQSINQSILQAHEVVFGWGDSGVLSYQDLCLSGRSRKIQYLLGYNSAVEIYFKNVTDRLDREKSEIEPFPLMTNHCKYQCFSWLSVLKFLCTDQ